MKRRPLGGALVVAAVVAVATSLVARTASAEGLRLEDAVREALSRNERARKAPYRVEQAEGQKQRARSAFLPSLSATGSGALNGTEDRNGNITTTTGALTLQQPILAPSAFPSYAQASHQVEAEKYNAAQDRRLVAFDTARSFFTALAAERVLEAAKRRVERARANLDNANARAAAGLASTNDATRARVDLATAMREAANATGSVERAYLNLGFLVGRRVEPPLVPPEPTTRAAETIGDVERQRQQALDRRPDVRAAHERTEALRASAREPLYRLAPTIGLQGQLRVTPESPVPSQSFTQTAQLTLTWQIFDAGFRYADRRTRLAQANSQALDEALLRRSVENDVGLALASLKAAREAYRTAEEAVEAAQASVEETEILYRQGLARAIELTDANARRFDAEVSRASSKLTMEQAYLELRFALGFDPIDEDTK